MQATTRNITGARLGVLAVGLLAAAAANAALGEGVASVERDGVALRAAAVTTTSFGAFERHDMLTGGGATVREFADRDGTVFAVDFTGRALPDLRAVLGARYDAWVAAVGRAQRQHNHHVSSVEADGLVVSIVRSQREVHGHAYLPALFPAGVGLQDLK